MSAACCSIRVGQSVPDFKMETYEPVKGNFGEVGLLRKLRANIHLAANPAEVCPAQWKKEGDKTLKPSAKIMGKIHEALK
jgi:hypothetical protein